MNISATVSIIVYFSSDKYISCSCVYYLEKEKEKKPWYLWEPILDDQAAQEVMYSKSSL